MFSESVTQRKLSSAPLGMPSLDVIYHNPVWLAYKFSEMMAMRQCGVVPN